MLLFEINFNTKKIFFCLLYMMIALDYRYLIDLFFYKDQIRKLIEHDEFDED